MKKVVEAASKQVENIKKAYDSIVKDAELKKTRKELEEINNDPKIREERIK
jgi:hypothetical protein